MRRELRPVEELFARFMAMGYTKREAMLAARPEIKSWSYNAVSNEATKVFQRPGVVDRIRDLAAAAERATVVSVATISERIDRDWELAHASGNAGAAVSATKLKAQLHRHLDRDTSPTDVLKDVVSLIDGLDRLTRARSGDLAVDVTPEKDNPEE